MISLLIARWGTRALTKLHMHTYKITYAHRNNDEGVKEAKWQAETRGLLRGFPGGAQAQDPPDVKGIDHKKDARRGRYKVTIASGRCHNDGVRPWRSQDPGAYGGKP